MTNSNKLKVLLYFDGSQHSFSAAVYTANLMRNIPEMHLTVLQVQEDKEGSRSGDLIEVWPSSPTSYWVKNLMDEADSEKKLQYSGIMAKTNELFTERGYDIDQQVIYSDPDVSDKADVIISYATENDYELIVMGTRGLTSLKGLIYGSLAHSVLNKSDIPVLLIKKLPQEFVDSYCANQEL